MLNLKIEYHLSTYKLQKPNCHIEFEDRVPPKFLQTTNAGQQRQENGYLNVFGQILNGSSQRLM